MGDVDLREQPSGEGPTFKRSPDTTAPQRITVDDFSALPNPLPLPNRGGNLVPDFIAGLTTGVATTSALAITAGSALAKYDDDTRMAAITTLALLAGVFMVIAGLLRLGRLLRFISNSVVIGFLTGVSINVILSQMYTARTAQAGRLWQQFLTRCG